MDLRAMRRLAEGPDPDTSAPSPEELALVRAAEALLARINKMTSDEFSKGGEKRERDALERALKPYRKAKWAAIRTRF